MKIYSLLSKIATSLFTILFAFIPYGFVDLENSNIQSRANVAEAATESPGGVDINLNLWLKADAGTDTTTDGTQIATWSDQSSNGFDVTAAGGVRPTFQNDAASLVNFNPSVLFDGTDDLMERAAKVLPNTANLTAIGDHTLFAVSIGNGGLFTQEGLGTAVTPYFSSDGKYVHSDTSGFISVSGAGSSTSIPTLQSAVKNGRAVQLSRNGLAGNAGTLRSTLKSPSGNRTTIGGRDQGSSQRRFGGRLLELIAYESDVTASKIQIESYLALKYGITLDQSTATDYLASDGSTKMWDSSVAGAYKNDIFGIGRDDNQALDQRASKSVNVGDVLTVATTADFTSANNAAGRTSLSNLQFLTIANDGGATTTQTTEINNGLYSQRVIREWQAQNTNSVGAVNLKFDGFDNTYVLLTDVDGDFSTTGDQTNRGVLSASGEIANVTLDNNTYFTVAEVNLASFTQSATTLTVGENGGTGTYTIVLDTEPTSDVVIDLSSNDTTEGTVSPSSLTFTSANWDTTQTVTVTGVDDSTWNTTDTGIVTNTVNASSATEYLALSTQTISVTYTDDDVDITPPTQPIIDSVREGDDSISGTGEPDTVITLAPITCGNDPITVILDGTWECLDSSPDPQVGEIIRAVSTDDAGNTNSGSIIVISKKSSKKGSRKLSQTEINKIFGTETDTLGNGEQCSLSQLLTQNVKAGAQNGQFNSYTGTTAFEVKILQAHMNRLGFASGQEDGILGSITDGAIKRMQKHLGTFQDGYVGPITRSLINNSCGGEAVEETITITEEVFETIEDAKCFINYSRLIKLNTEGEDVKQVQTCMNSLGYSTGVVDGIYGGITYTGIRSYQTSNKLLLDGIIGPETAGYLNALSGVALNGVTPLV